jgi:hypothetical protein
MRGALMLLEPDDWGGPRHPFCIPKRDRMVSSGLSPLMCDGLRWTSVELCC